ncbi:MAG TPA: D-amino acid dehydrogenase [Burkholderiales bacterium]|nr:D-amino acid dehydrogenase [Burkholderiales bacterium]
MRVAVLGAGVVGVTSAWYLAQAGHEVTVIERQPEAARETSFANGGQISVSHAEPWANPRAPAQILKWLGRSDAPLRFRPRADPAQWAWGLRFLAECLPWRTRANTLAVLALAKHSQARLRELRSGAGIEYHCLTRGILHLFTERSDWVAAGPRAELVRRHGIEATLLSPEECLALEPALAGSRAPLAGGLYAAGDESGDARLFTERLAILAASRGVSFRYGERVLALEAAGDRIAGARLESGAQASADAWVVALGSYSPLLLRPLGVALGVYPVKGYSVTLPIGPRHRAPTLSVTDEARKLVFSRLGDRLRVAGTAELAGYDTTLDPARCAAILKRVFELFPEAGDRGRAELWTGLRPATPGNVPVIGRTRYRNLFLNTGHGTLGWTLSCGSGHALAEIVSGRRPGIKFPFRDA